MTDKTFDALLKAVPPVVRKALAALNVTDLAGLGTITRKQLQDVAIPGSEKGVGALGAAKAELVFFRDFGVALAQEQAIVRNPGGRKPLEPVAKLTAYLRKANKDHGIAAVNTAIDKFRSAAA